MRVDEHKVMREAYIAAGRPRICPRCGGRASGLHLPHCSDRGWNHSETCAIYRYSSDVCPPCATALAARHAALTLVLCGERA